MKIIKKVVIIILIFIISYSFGVLSHKYQIFPYNTIRSVFNPKPAGRWNIHRNVKRQNITKELEKLATLPYLPGYKTAPKLKNVTVFKKGLVHHGYNLYSSGHAPEAFLIDMKGRVVHNWSFSFDKVWPDYSKRNKPWHGYHWWTYVHLLENGDLFAIFERIGLIKINKNSNVLWAYQGGCHHDLCIDTDGYIYVLTVKPHIIPEINKIVPILEDFITILSPDGKEVKQFSILQIFLNSSFSYLIPPVNKIEALNFADIFHTNSIEVFDGKLSNKCSIFKKGNILISIRNINVIAIIDLNTKKIVWLYGPNNLIYQHKPTLLDNGNILIFDNGIEYSRVIEVDPLSYRIVWEYSDISQNKFFSATHGTGQRLPNGNTLITESDNGRAFEVTYDLKTVWEYLNPHRAGKNNELIATLFEMTRIDFPLNFLNN